MTLDERLAEFANRYPNGMTPAEFVAAGLDVSREAATVLAKEMRRTTDNDAADRRDAPKATATSRELAKPHPWECDE